ncbi:hypothetical protein BGX34_003883 [Mortierella sp. NVP85]|nr:hypothetical protein BGX34_003883 [Mortierella sp. NVP85]
MKFTAVLTVALAGIAATSAHSLIAYPPPRGGYGTKNQKHGFSGNIQSFINYHDDNNGFTVKFPCGGYDPRSPVTKFKAGQIVDVQFAITDQYKRMDDKRKHSGVPPPMPKRRSGNRFDKMKSNPRHGGGECEFHLSYDGGKTLNTIGRYTKTCPSIYDKWPVKIPDNAKECKQKGKCLFVWTWLAHTLPQWYMNCADIELTNTKVSPSKQKVPPKMNSNRLNALSKKGLKLKAPGEAGYGNDLYEDSGPISKEKNDNRNGIIPKSSLKI